MVSRSSDFPFASCALGVVVKDPFLNPNHKNFTFFFSVQCIIILALILGI